MGRGARNLILLTASPTTEKRLRQDLSEFYRLRFAQSGAEALRILREATNAAVIMDHSLEDFMTDQFIDKVRNNPVTRDTPFILVSREGSNFFVHQAVRSGVSHYIGIPYERNVLIEKIEMALDAKGSRPKKIYFELPAQIQTQAVSFGRISYIHPGGLHFETHLKLNEGDEVEFSCSLAEGIKEISLKAKVKSISNDCFYNYPLAVDADWVDPKIAQKVRTWIVGHQNLNSPKKAKILCVGLPLTEEELLIKAINQSRYSLRFSENLSDALANMPFLRPSGFAITAQEWNKNTKVIQQKALKELEKYQATLIIRGALNAKDSIASAFECPDSAPALAQAVEQRIPPKPSEPDRLYFSKALEDSRIKIFVNGKILKLGELGVTIAFEREFLAPCNLQIDLKLFTEQNLRNPYMRVWPPMMSTSPFDSENGKWKFSFACHFLGINDSQGQAIRQWLRDEEMKEKRAEIHIAPLTKIEQQQKEEAMKAAEVAKKAAVNGGAAAPAVAVATTAATNATTQAAPVATTTTKPPAPPPVKK